MENLDYKVLASSENNVWKYIFEKPDAIMEAVLYKYNDFYERTVICCSVQSGCPVGCTFCGTGAEFVRNLRADEIVAQIKSVLTDKGLDGDINEKCKKLQFMFMSMGEPMLNWNNTKEAIYKLNESYSNAQLLLSTVGIKNEKTLVDLIETSKNIDQMGLQFSIHKSNDDERNTLIPFKNKMCLEQIRDFGQEWHGKVGRKPYCNYCIDGSNNSERDFENLTSLFDPRHFNFTFSVVCSANETMKNAGFRNMERIQEFQQKFSDLGYNVRTFDPAGQDDIGGGCGQLWYVQKWLKENRIKDDRFVNVPEEKLAKIRGALERGTTCACEKDGTCK